MGGSSPRRLGGPVSPGHGRLSTSSRTSLHPPAPPTPIETTSLCPPTCRWTLVITALQEADKALGSVPTSSFGGLPATLGPSWGKRTTSAYLEQCSPGLGSPRCPSQGPLALTMMPP